jgi:hypothetical protein
MFNCRCLVHHLARRAVLAAGLLAFTGLAGAADAPVPTPTPKPPAGKPATAASAAGTPIDGWAVTLVTARAVVKPGDARALTDRFTRRSAIHAQATFTTEGNPQAGPVKFEVKWFNGQRRVSTKKIDAVVGTSPHYVAVQTSGNAVGEGDGRVEVYANGKLMASRRFRVDAI